VPNIVFSVLAGTIGMLVLLYSILYGVLRLCRIPMSVGREDGFTMVAKSPASRLSTGGMILKATFRFAWIGLLFVVIPLVSLMVVLVAFGVGGMSFGYQDGRIVAGFQCDGRKSPAWKMDYCGNYVYASQSDNFVVAVITPYTGLGGSLQMGLRSRAVFATHPSVGTFDIPCRSGFITVVDETHRVQEFKIPRGFVADYLDKADADGTHTYNLHVMLAEVAEAHRLSDVSAWLAEHRVYEPMGNRGFDRDWPSGAPTTMAEEVQKMKEGRE
jgi:hypothetical protein